MPQSPLRFVILIVAVVCKDDGVAVAHDDDLYA